MDTSRRYWTTHYLLSFEEELELRVCFRVLRGKVDAFSIVLRKKEGNDWYTVKRCDNTKIHGSVPHCHIYKRKGKKYVQFFDETTIDCGTIATNLIEDFKTRYHTIVENYEYSN